MINKRIKKTNMFEYNKIQALLIEDNPGDVRLINEMFNDFETKLITLIYKSSLSEGLKSLSEEKFDVVLLDLSLPDSQGLNTLSSVLEKNPDIPIIVLTGTDNKSLAIEAVRFGAQDYLIKNRLDNILLERSIYYAIERHRIKQEMKNLTKDLQLSETRSKTLIENAPLPIFLLNQKGKILNANESAIELFEYKTEELSNLTIFDLFDKKYLDIAKKHFYQDLYNLIISNKIDALVKSKNEKNIHVEIKSTIIKVAESIFILSFFYDITERKKYEKNRGLFLERLHASLELKSRFFATISHEFRTPLNAILGFSEILVNEYYGDLTEEQKEFATNILSAGEDLLELINTILDISKIESGRFELFIENTDLYEIVKETKNILEPSFIKKNLQFSFEGIKKNDYLTIDPLRFKQILFNLLSNAIKFTDKGSVSLRAIEKNHHWEFQIIDTGIGIAKEDYDIIFKEFGRIHTDLTEEVQGAGLGLALTKRLVQLHGGEIWFESEVGKGTTFYFIIPKKI